MRIADGTGDLMLTTARGRELRHARPNVYQQTDDKRVPVQGRYQLRSPGHVDVMLAAYDRQLPVVIDPTVTFVQTFGSSVYEGVTASALDFTTTYAAGFTLSTQFPVSNGSSYQAGVCNQAFCSSATNGFVVKINSAGIMLFSTYVGPGPGGAEGIAVDSSGVYVTGSWRIPDSGNVIGYAGGGVVEGSDQLQEATDVWTFARRSGGKWELSAIQQT